MNISKNDVKNTTNSRRARGRPRGWADTSDQNTIKSLERAMGEASVLKNSIIANWCSSRALAPLKNTAFRNSSNKDLR